MSISTNTKSQQSNIFNPSDYIDDQYISRSEADIRFLNQNVAYEKMFGSLDIVNDATMTNQLVTGNSVINGSLTANTINGGNELDQGKFSTIKGNVTLGDTGWGTQVTLNGQVLVGTNTGDVKIKGATTEINKDSAGGNITIGNGVNTLTVNGALSVNSGSNNISMNANTIGLNSSGTSATTCNIGQVNNTTNLNGTVNIGSVNKATKIDGNSININTSGTSGNTAIGNTNLNTTTSLNGTLIIGSSTKETSFNASNIILNTTGISGNTTVGNINLNTSGTSGTTTIGNNNPNTTTQVNGVFYVGNGTKQIAMSGSDINLNTISGSGNTTIGMSQITSGQSNVFLSSQNLLYNPKICDNVGNVSATQFCFNSPSFCSFNQGISFNSSTNTFTLPGLSSRVVYLNLPNLPNYGFYAITFEYTLHILMGTLSGVNGQTGVKIIPYSRSISNGADTNTSRGRYCYGQFILYVNRQPGSSTPYVFSYLNITGTPEVPFNTQNFSYISNTASNTSTNANFQPLTVSNITGASQSTNKIKMQMNLPNINQNIALGDFCICASGSFRIISSVSNDFVCTPNNSSNGLGGEAYFSLS